MPYRYRPADNRTPVTDFVFGHLEWDGVYDDPRCADDPRFEEIQDLASSTREELNGLAAQAGVPDPHKLPNKQAVLDAIANPPAAHPDGPGDPDPDPDPDPSADTAAEQPPAEAGDAGGNEH